MGVVDTSGKFTADVFDTGGDLLAVSLSLEASLPRVSTTPAAKFTSGVVVTVGLACCHQFAASVDDTSGKLPPVSLIPEMQYLREFLKKFEITSILFSGAWGEDDS